MLFFAVHVVIISVIVDFLVNGALELFILGHFRLRNSYSRRSALAFTLSLAVAFAATAAFILFTQTFSPPTNQP